MRRLSVLLPLILAACGHVPLSTMYQLRNFDPANFDPALLRVAVQISDRIAPRPDGMRLRIRLWRKEAPEAKATHEFQLLQVLDPGELAPLAGFHQSGTKIHAYRLSPEDAGRVRFLQVEAREAKAINAGRNMLDLAVEAKTCRFGELPSGPLFSTTLIRTAPSAGYLVLLQGVDLRAELQKAGKDVAAEIPTCL